MVAGSLTRGCHSSGADTWRPRWRRHRRGCPARCPPALPLCCVRARHLLGVCQFLPVPGSGCLLGGPAGPGPSGAPATSAAPHPHRSFTATSLWLHALQHSAPPHGLEVHFVPLCAAPVLFLVVKHPRDAVGGAQPNMLMPSSSLMLRAPATGRIPAGQGLSRARGLAAAAGVAGAITLLAAHQHHATALNGAKPRHAPRRCGACVAVWGVTMHPLVGRAVWAPLRRASQPDCQPASRRPTVCTPGGCN